MGYLTPASISRTRGTQKSLQRVLMEGPLFPSQDKPISPLTDPSLRIIIDEIKVHGNLSPSINQGTGLISWAMRRSMGPLSLRQLVDEGHN